MPDSRVAIIIVGPRGSGKNMIEKAIRHKFRFLHKPVSHTTRKRRPKEVRGRDYHFVSSLQFKRMVEARKFAWSEHIGPVQQSGCSILEFDAHPQIVLDLTHTAAQIAKQRIEKQGGRALILRIYAPEHIRRQRIRQRQPGIMPAEIDRLIREDPVPATMSIGFDSMINNSNPDPKPAHDEAIRLVQKFLNE